MAITYRLSGDDGIVLPEGQTCAVISDLSQKEADYALVEMSPPLTGLRSLKGATIRFAVLHPRLAGERLFPPSKIPLCVHVAVAPKPIRTSTEALESWNPNAWTILIWALLEPTQNDSGKK
jgi:hypothetical protein